MNDLFTKLSHYCEAHTSPQPPLLHQLERETHLKTLAPQMLSGHLQGRFLSLLSKMQRPATIVEVGSFTGYGTLCLAEGLAEGGVLHAIEANPELEYIIRKYISWAKLEGRAHLHIGEAQRIIPKLDGPFDMVFIDAGKQDYALFYNLVIDKMAAGGLIIADNVLWSGKVLPDKRGQDQDAGAIHRFNEMVQQDERVENIMLPLRDGLLIARKY